jgi:hypothetical protein
MLVAVFVLADLSLAMGAAGISGLTPSEGDLNSPHTIPVQLVNTLPLFLSRLSVEPVRVSVVFVWFAQKTACTLMFCAFPLVMSHDRTSVMVGSYDHGSPPDV